MKGRVMYLAIDIGGTNGRVWLFWKPGDTTPIDSRTFKMSGNYRKDYGSLLRACNDLIVRHGPAYGRLEGIGVALAGRLDKARSKLLASPNLPDWKDRPIVSMLQAAFRCPVMLGNDTEAAALAEALYGDKDRRRRDFWYVGWGTGVGGARVEYIDGAPRSVAGEPGHQCVDPRSTLVCGCGQTGCLEAYCGGNGIEKRFEVEAKYLSDEQWSDVLGWMAIGVRNLVTIQPVTLVVFGGGVTAKQTKRLDELRALLAADLRIVEPPEVLQSELGEDTACFGAFALIQSR